MSKSLPRKSGLTLAILRTAVAQLLFLDTPPHAAIGLAVDVACKDRNARHFSGVVNAVLRKVSESPRQPAAADAGINTPEWLWRRWTRHYGEDLAAGIALAHLEEPATDIAVKSDGQRWADLLGAQLLFPDHLRLPPSAPAIPTLPGFASGDWWVQDVAASLPVRMLGDVAGKNVIDLCAAPGGKTLQLCARGARVTAVDISQARLERLRENLTRTGLAADLVCTDLREIADDRSFDAVLLDAPCSATGTIRRHPEILHVRSESDIRRLARQQEDLLKHAARLVAPGGMLVFSTCSLEPEEGEIQIENFLERENDFRIWEQSLLTDHSSFAISKPGMVRTLPHHSIGPARGMDGFFVAALRRMA